MLAERVQRLVDRGLVLRLEPVKVAPVRAHQTLGDGRKRPLRRLVDMRLRRGGGGEEAAH